MESSEHQEDPVETLRRWTEFGATWEVVHSTSEQVTVSLRRCDGGEEVERLVSNDPRLREYVERASSD
ncbi:MAG TPA: hypothetical protein VFG72_06950 [Marmoricola sp.]|nr:hypothetical protein [Marmoricola sp.]